MCKDTTHDNNRTEFKLEKVTEIAKSVGDVARSANNYAQPILLRKFIVKFLKYSTKRS